MIYLILTALFIILASILIFAGVNRNRRLQEENKRKEIESNRLAEEKRRIEEQRRREELELERRKKEELELKLKREAEEKALKLKEAEERKRKQQEEEERKRIQREKSFAALQKQREAEQRLKEEQDRIERELAQKAQEEKEARRAAAIKKQEESLRKKREEEERLEAEYRKKLVDEEQARKRLEEEKASKREEEKKLREQKQKEERQRQLEFFYSPLDEELLKKHFSASAPSSSSICPLKGKLKFPEPSLVTLKVEQIPSLLQVLMEMNGFVKTYRQRAFCILEQSNCLIQIPHFITLDNWIGFPCDLTIIQAEHIKRFEKGAKFGELLDTRTTDPNAIRVPSYPDILELINLTKDVLGCTDVDIARQIIGLLNGVPCTNRCSVFIYLCMFGAESVRCSRWCTINMMLLDLICTGRLTWANVFGARTGGLGFYPPSTISAVHNSHSPQNPSDTITEEARVIKMWINAMLGNPLDTPIDLSHEPLCELLVQRLLSMDVMLKPI